MAKKRKATKKGRKGWYVCMTCGHESKKAGRHHGKAMKKY